MDSVVTFNEVMYHPADGAGEWVELHNPLAVDVDISGWRLDGAVGFVFPDGAVVPRGGHLVVAPGPGDPPGALGPWEGRLDNAGETLRLLNNSGRVMDEMAYRDGGRWPVAPDGSGISLAKLRPETASADPANWGFRTVVGGTPGQRNFSDPDDPGVPATTEDRELVPVEGEWRYNESGADLGAGWAAAAHPAGGDWKEGGGLLAFAPGAGGMAAPPELVSYWSFDEADSGTAPAGDPVGGNGGTFTGGARRAPGLVGAGAARFDNAAGSGVNVGTGAGGGFSVRGGITVEALIASGWGGAGFDYDEIFRKEDGANRVLLSFQNDGNNGGANPAVPPGPVLSFGLNVGGVYRELDMPLDGAAGRPSLAAITDGVHHVAATYDSGSGLKAIYIDGELRHSVTESGQISSGGGAPAVIGNLSSGGEPFTGVIDEVAFYRRALTAGEVAAHAALALGGANYFGALPAPVNTTLADPRAGGVTTVYFEREFEFSAETLDNLLGLRLSHAVDDGAVFYLNGVEVHRFNLPAGPVTAGTPAAAAVVDAAVSGPFALPRELLVAGANRLSAEVHQSGAGGDDDLVFGAAVEATVELTPAIPPGGDPAPPADGLVISEIPAGGGATFWVELVNNGGQAVDLAGVEIVNPAPDGGGGSYRFSGAAGAEVLAPGDTRLVDGGELGFGAADEAALFLYAPGRSDLLDAVRVKARPLARTAGAGRTDPFYTPAALTPGDSANVFSFESAVVINEIMYHHSPQYATGGEPPREEVTPLLTLGATWRFNPSGAALGAGWAADEHPVGAGWESGPGPIAFETSAGVLPVPAGTALPFPGGNDPFVITYYFETEFTLTEAEFDQLDALHLTHLIDDGAVFYLNGAEVARYCMPAGAITAATLAECRDEARRVGPVVVGREFVFPGSNRLSVEVHQGSADSSDVVFGLEVDRVTQVPSGNPPRPFAEDDEEWIELYNRGGDPVDLTGWSLRDAVAFDFPPGTQIGAGEFLVVARDPAALSRRHPGARVVGGFAGRLGDGGERIVLEDAARNPADQVHYRDGGRWPAAADGGGSSLELRDPAADNAAPEAWSASDEAAGAAWTTFSYRADGMSFAGSSDPAGYHELVVGLLDAGEVLIDDLSVVEDPGGAARELVQNGGFEGDTAGAAPSRYRALGNHGRHGRTRVVDDPGGGGKVLHLVATGPMWHLHDHLETTLKAGATFVPIRSAQTYEISFRARWLSGSPQLNTRLYFNRAAKTHILPLPAAAGTPGAPNPARVDNLGPTFGQLRHRPVSPAPGEAVSVTVRAGDPDGVASAHLLWSRDGGAFQSAALTLDGDGDYRATIPGQPAAALVQFFVEAVDGRGQTARFPAGGEASRALFRVGAGGVAGAGNLHRLEILMVPADAAALGAETDLMSNDRVGATAVFNGRACYDVGVRLKGSQRGRPDPGRRGFNIEFPAGEEFRGVHRSIGLDRSGGWRFGRTNGQDEILIWHFINRAGGVPSMHNDLVHLVAPGIAPGPAQLQMARYGDNFLEGQYPNGGEGSLHNYELIYHPTTTTGGPEGLKRPNPDGVSGVPIRDLGPDAEAYRYYFQLRNNRARDDYGGVVALGRLFSLGGAEMRARALDVIDVDQWLRAYAAVALAGVSDSYFNNTNAHNARFYQRPSDGRMLLFPWDMDFAFITGATSSLTPNSDLDRLISEPVFRRLYYGHINDLVERSFNAGYMAGWVAHYDRLLPGQGLSSITGYIADRAAHARAEVERAVPPVDFAITTNGGIAFSAGASPVTLEGEGWVDVRGIRLAGSSRELPVTWTGTRAWRVQVPLDGAGANPITLEALGFTGEVLATATILVTNTGAAVAASAANLVVSEVMYHPPGPDAEELAAGFGDADDFEFIEFLNRGAEAIDLTGVEITDGVRFRFAEGFTLGPGGRAVVVKNPGAFGFRYAGRTPAPTVAGDYLGTGTGLANGGERVAVVSARGETITTFAYRDAAPWPAAADGAGHSLVLIAPDRAGGADPADPASWRSSRDAGGLPGGDDRSRYLTWREAHGVGPNAAGDDPDGDGRVNLLEYAFGGDPNVPDPAPGGVAPVSLPGGRDGGGVGAPPTIGLAVTLPTGADDAAFAVRFSEHPADFPEGRATDYLGTESNGDGTRTMTFAPAGEAGAGPGNFARVAVRLRN